MAAPPLLGKHQRQASSPLLEFSGNVTVELTIVALEINVATVPTYRKEKELELEAHFKVRMKLEGPGNQRLDAG